ncbi:MAG: GNAT family N-acetyltransferase [bacterium]|nr:GNAT family N-acetyltransferase [bacterium]MCM1374558.1 GNAT family N-acetyltransferase [Muribaculum sp.]
MMGRELEQGKLYLKTCIVVLRSALPLPALLPLCERLVRVGISCKVMLTEELWSEEGKPGLSEEDVQGILYLTDDPRAYSVLAEDFHRPVLIYLHAGNREEDFGDARYALEEPEETEPEYLERVYRRCQELPWEILTTARCWLRETVEEDVDSFWTMYQDTELTRYTERLYPTPEAERGYIRDYRRLVYPFYEFGVWTVLDRESGAVVGRAGLSVREGYDLPELGFVIGREWQGRGLAKEVCLGVLDYASRQLGFERIQVLVHEENTVSLRLCQQLGFREQDRQGEEHAPAGLTSGRVEMEQNGQRVRLVYMVYEAAPTA